SFTWPLRLEDTSRADLAASLLARVTNLASESLRLFRSFRIAWRSEAAAVIASLAAVPTASLPRLSDSLTETGFASLPNWDWASGRVRFWSIGCSFQHGRCRKACRPGFQGYTADSLSSHSILV